MRTHFYHLQLIKSISNRKCHPISLYHFKKLFYQLYHTILQNTQHPKTLLFYHSIKILFFNLSLLFLFNVISFLNSTVFKFNYSNGQFSTTWEYFFFFSISFQLFQQPGCIFLFFQFLSNYFNNLPKNFFFNFFPTILTTYQFFFRKNLPNINVLKFANFKNLHTYIFHQTCQISM